MRAIALAASLAFAIADPNDVDRAEFAAWKIMNGRQYANGEEETRLANYLTNRAKAEELNARDPFATYGENQFSDLSAAEFRAMYANSRPFYTQPKDPSVTEWPLYSDAEVVKAMAISIDWRIKGAVTPVKNQGQCGSCWAFSTTGNVEGAWQIAKGTLVSMSESQLLDCDHNGDHGCGGGMPSSALEYVQKNGLETEQDYPYVAKAGLCKASSSKTAVTIDGQTKVASDEGQMLAFLQVKGPISIGVDAQDGWQQYKSGIKNACYSSSLDHGVLIVGYGIEGPSPNSSLSTPPTCGCTAVDPRASAAWCNARCCDTTPDANFCKGQWCSCTMPYWIIKNSWGTSFGEEGYIRVAYGKNCDGLKNDPVSAVVNGNLTGNMVV